MIKAIDKFIAAIADPQLPRMFNPWSQYCETELDKQGWKYRQQRLKIHLNCPHPKLIIIGEAPGYQGCRFSGIAFTSERLLLEGLIPRIPNLQGQRITNRTKPWSEPSATIVWKALYEYGLADKTVMFNAVPWHPEGNKGVLSNRTPSVEEKHLGEKYLDMLLKLYPGVAIAALGNTASANLNTLGISHAKLRHPANGGANKFRAGLAEISLEV